MRDNCTEKDTRSSRKSPLLTLKGWVSELFVNGTSVTHWEKMWYGTTSGELDDLLKICHLEISINLPLKSVGQNQKTCISYIFFYFFIATHITWCKLTLSFILTYNEQPHHIQSIKTAKSLINYENNK